LRPTARLLEHAGSSNREKESLLLRDLKLGMNHIDREQLRRNGLLSPRYPTSILQFSACIESVAEAHEIVGVDLMGSTGTMFKIKCEATVEVVASDYELERNSCYRGVSNEVASVLTEEWAVFRSFKDFQAFHKHLKNQVAVSESSGTPGSRLVGAATAAFAAGTIAQGRHRQRQVLIPSLSNATKAVTLAATKKSVLKRKEFLDAYLTHLLGVGNLLNRCSELLLFLGASYPLPPDIAGGVTVSRALDTLGRTEMSRTILEYRDSVNEHTLAFTQSSRTGSAGGTPNVDPDDDIADDSDDFLDSGSKSVRKIDMIPSIKNKIDKVPLALVRNRLFELLRYQFGFENASFLRSRMLAALKTASIAVTSASEFRRTLYKLHTEYVSAEGVARLIRFAVDILWPGGVFFSSAPPLSPEELERASNNAREALHNAFPDQVRAVLGQELTRDGMDILHEMLQNRLVVKSMAYTLFDLIWFEVFPEIGDVLEGGGALDLDG
jgi:Sorting nexin C terminal/PX domain